MITRFFERVFYLFFKNYVGRYLKSIRYAGGDVLDIGCGYGFYSDIFGKNYVGIDIDADAIDSAWRLYPDKHFEIGDATHLQFENNRFELIISVLVLHHIDDVGLIALASQLKRVLKEGGHVFIVDMVLPKRLAFLARPVFYFDQKAYPRTIERLLELLRDDSVSLEYATMHRFLTIALSIMSFKKV